MYETFVFKIGKSRIPNLKEKDSSDKTVELPYNTEKKTAW